VVVETFVLLGIFLPQTKHNHFKAAMKSIKVAIQYCSIKCFSPFIVFAMFYQLLNG
jgi:hypothetical protein